MIFVTVGTHEQQFNRLIKEVDRLVEEGIIEEEVFIQTGYSDYEPKYCQWKKFLNYDEMENYIEEANIVITHGGPASFMGVLNKNKVPIVVPRKLEFEEHVNDHQLEFCEKVIDNGYYIIAVNDIDLLKNALNDATKLNKKNNSTLKSNNNSFCIGFNKVVEKLL
ncbi:multidrug MFS transporter [Enterococcus casseliflavus]|uniref:PssE/Cps14G family polysaccharide biosynthesis glycosyltransferase n=1 Tax=Enterococcus TaxID=1350 RepID=UPI001432CE11|nr:PssE/Cps14G family polysaccharide biosynthesis glycosyltransferase [Enterococcus casseliflavus]NKD37695.1 multidrug MFS transporter [Enterococcus casseliflavus]